MSSTSHGFKLVNSIPLDEKPKPKGRTLDEYKKDIHWGCWFMLHFMAARATTPERMKAYAFHFKELCDEMTDCNCDSHCHQMLAKYPPENYFTVLFDENGEAEGCLYHSWLCHNEVRTRQGKVTYPYEQVRAIWKAPKKKKDCESDLAAQLRATSSPPPDVIAQIKSDVPAASISQVKSSSSQSRNGASFRFVSLG